MPNNQNTDVVHKGLFFLYFPFMMSLVVWIVLAIFFGLLWLTENYEQPANSTWYQYLWGWPGSNIAEHIFSMITFSQESPQPAQYDVIGKMIYIVPRLLIAGMINISIVVLPVNFLIKLVRGILAKYKK